MICDLCSYFSLETLGMSLPDKIQDVYLNVNIREGNGTPFQYSCLENSMGRGAWSAAVHRVAKTQT